MHEILCYTVPTLYPADQGYVRLEKIAAACDEPARNWDFGQKIGISSQTSSIEPSYKTGQKQVKISISPIAQGFLKIFRVQHVALTVRRPKHPCLAWCNTIFLFETFSRLVPRDSNLGHHTKFSMSRASNGMAGLRLRRQFLEETHINTP
jgi:hypothetical protein